MNGFPVKYDDEVTAEQTGEIAAPEFETGDWVEIETEQDEPMENDHLADAILFIRSAIEDLNAGRSIACHDLDRAIEEIEIEQRLAADRRMTSTGHQRAGD